MTKPTVLIVEDEPAIRDNIQFALESEGLQTLQLPTGGAVLSLLAERSVDLVVLDVGLPDISGFDLLKEIRKAHRTPVIMLTARSAELDRVLGLEIGADDYVVKPFSPSELIARLRAVMRRAQPASAEDVLRFADVAMDLVAHRVTRAGRPVHLGPTEFRLLRFLMQHPGRVFSREQLLDSVWGHDVYVEPRTVDVHIRRLRKALNEGTELDIVPTVRSAGYSLDQAQ